NGTAKNLNAAINNDSLQCDNKPSACFGSNTVANSSAGSSAGGPVVSLTSKTAGSAGNFALTSNNQTDICTSPNGTTTNGTNANNGDTHFAITGGSTTNNATNLAAAITRNGGTVGVGASSGGTSTVTVTASTAGAAGNNITLTSI